MKRNASFAIENGGNFDRTWDRAEVFASALKRVELQRYVVALMPARCGLDLSLEKSIAIRRFSILSEV